MTDSGHTDFKTFETRREASEALADMLEKDLAAGIKRNGRAALVVSGGRSPVGLFQALRTRALSWQDVCVIPSDERDVPLDHPDRNETMIQHELLTENATMAQLVSLIPPGDIPDHFDAVVLGMGDDGHTASLFPGSPDLPEALRSKHKLARLEVPRLGVYRVSLTPCALLSSQKIYLLIFGSEKRHVFEQALREIDPVTFPVSIVLGQTRVPVAVCWAP